MIWPTNRFYGAIFSLFATITINSRNKTIEIVVFKENAFYNIQKKFINLLNNTIYIIMHNKTVTSAIIGQFVPLLRSVLVLDANYK